MSRSKLPSTIFTQTLRGLFLLIQLRFLFLALAILTFGCRNSAPPPGPSTTTASDPKSGVISLGTTAPEPPPTSTSTASQSPHARPAVELTEAAAIEAIRAAKADSPAIFESDPVVDGSSKLISAVHGSFTDPTAVEAIAAFDGYPGFLCTTNAFLFRFDGQTWRLVADLGGCAASFSSLDGGEDKPDLVLVTAGGRCAQGWCIGQAYPAQVRDGRLHALTGEPTEGESPQLLELQSAAARCPGGTADSAMSTRSLEAGPFVDGMASIMITTDIEVICGDQGLVMDGSKFHVKIRWDGQNYQVERLVDG